MNQEPPGVVLKGYRWRCDHCREEGPLPLSGDSVENEQTLRLRAQLAHVLNPPGVCELTALLVWLENTAA